MIEASFYRQLADELPVRTPACWYAAHDPATNAYVVVLEDVAPAEQGDQMHGCSAADIGAAVDELALLHGPRWGDPTLLDLAWARRPTPEGVQATGDLITWAVESFRANYARAPRAGHGGARRSLHPGHPRLPRPRRPSRGPSCTATSAPTTSCSAGRGSSSSTGRPSASAIGPTDLAYLLGASLLPEVRRQHEGALVDRYVAGLAAHGVAVERDDVWAQYRRYAFGGLIMAIVAQALVRRTDRGDEMFITMADRHARQALDLDSEALV